MKSSPGVRRQAAPGRARNSVSPRRVDRARSGHTSPAPRKSPSLQASRGAAPLSRARREGPVRRRAVMAARAIHPRPAGASRLLRFGGGAFPHRVVMNGRGPRSSPAAAEVRSGHAGHGGADRSGDRRSRCAARLLAGAGLLEAGLEEACFKGFGAFVGWNLQLIRYMHKCEMFGTMRMHSVHGA